MDFESHILKQKTDEANRILREWIEQLIQFDEEDASSLYKVKSLFEQIIKSGTDVFSIFPKDYKYLSFINHILIPKAKNWLDVVGYSSERYVNIVLPIKLKQKLVAMLYEID
jgi:hypothetical protein